LDVLEQLATIYASFDPDQAFGITLDQRCAINGVIRNAGTYTQQPITLTITSTVTLYGLDNQANNPFTVSDSSNNQYQLLVTQTFAPGVYPNIAFQAALLGPVSSVTNSITTIVTVFNGVASVNNPSTYTYLGQNEETDAQLRVRRAASVSLPSRGYLEGLYGSLLTIDGVEYVSVLENDANTTNSQGIPPHSIWVTVSTGTALTSSLKQQIATVIYNERMAGSGQTNTGTGCTLTCTVSSGAINTVTITNGGTGYIYSPTVKVSGGGGSGAIITLIPNSAGVITSYTITNGGTGYTSAPTLSVNPYTTAYPITQIDGSTFYVYWDLPVLKSIYFKAQIDAITGTVPTLSNLATEIASATSYNIGQSADASSLVSLIKELAPNCYVSNAFVSLDNSTWVSIVQTSSLAVSGLAISYQFTLPSSNITLTS